MSESGLSAWQEICSAKYDIKMRYYPFRPSEPAIFSSSEQFDPNHVGSARAIGQLSAMHPRRVAAAPGR